LKRGGQQATKPKGDGRMDDYFSPQSFKTVGKKYCKKNAQDFQNQFETTLEGSLLELFRIYELRNCGIPGRQVCFDKLPERIGIRNEIHLRNHQILLQMDIDEKDRGSSLSFITAA